MPSSLRVLLCNYYWPPSGGPAVQRWLDFARLLLPHQITLTVVTIAPAVATYPLRDFTLLQKVPEAVKVYTTDTQELFWLYKKLTGRRSVKPVGLSESSQNGWKQQLAQFVRGNAFLPDPRRGWNRHAYQKASALHKASPFDVVITAGPPHSTHLVGKRLKQRWGIPWLADFHDEWTTHWNLKQFYRTWLAHQFDRALERRILHQADAVLAHCQSARQLLAPKIAPSAQEKLHTVYMGYDAALFLESPQRVLSGESFNVVYTGTLGESYHPEGFLQAWKHVQAQFPTVPLTLCFAGVISPRVRQLIKEYGIEHSLNDLGYLPHKDAVALARNADVLLLVNPVFAGEKRIIPGKLFEYMAARKPILNLASPESESAALIRQTETGATFAHTDTAGITSFLQMQIEKWQQTRHTELVGNEQQIALFTRQAQTEKLVKVLRTLASS